MKTTHLLFVALGGCTTLATESTIENTTVLQDSAWTIHALGNRCWDLADGKGSIAAGNHVTLRSCGGPFQQIRVKEIGDGSHDVMLATPGNLDRPPAFCIAADSGAVFGHELILQACAQDQNGMPAPNQRFAFDGDAVLMGNQRLGHATRDWAIESSNANTNEGAHLMVGLRDVDDSEYFRMTSTVPTAIPHGGFVTVADEASLDTALAGGWGMVVQVDSKNPLVLRGDVAKKLYDGQTLRGYRKFLDDGPSIKWGAPGPMSPMMFSVVGSHVRVTGLRMIGTSERVERDQAAHYAVDVDYALADHRTDVIVDHVQAYGFTEAAFAAYSDDNDQIGVCPTVMPAIQPPGLRVIDSFIHHNEMQGAGYGVEAAHGAFVTITGTTMYANRHSISSDFRGTTSYTADSNLVQIDTPVYPDDGPQQDFDKHGSADPPHWMGGISNNRVIFRANTFLSTNRVNIFERGTPCGETQITSNGFRSSQSVFPIFGPIFTGPIKSLSTDHTRTTETDSRYSIDDPTEQVAVGDFDGDGQDDVFMATGNTWWYSSGGQREWRFLSRKDQRVKDLRFGDLDGDGRTDVFTVSGTSLAVSWGGLSPWIHLDTVPSGSIDDVAVADLTGDKQAELILADGTSWFKSSFGHTWTFWTFHPERAKDLRFGDFTGDGKPDVLGRDGGTWKIVPYGQSAWQPWAAFTDDMFGWFVGDFDGDGISDVIGKINGDWKFSRGAKAALVTLQVNAPDLVGKAIGKFDADAKTDVMTFGDDRLLYVNSAGGTKVEFSRYDLR